MEELGILHLLGNEEYNLRDCRPFHDAPEFHVSDDDFETPPPKKTKQQQQQEAATNNTNARSDNHVSAKKVIMSDCENGGLSENFEKESTQKASESIFVHTRVEALKHVAEAILKRAEVAEKDETFLRSGFLRSGGQTSDFHDTTVDEVKRKTSFPSFDDWDYPISSESQIVVCEKSFARVPETPFDPMPLAQVSEIPDDPTLLAQVPGI
ncbi:hypothetical protein K7X08_030777 [Anisodus acutangulus]|uniref:Uncharacterized protein n=1 Tax=Anisodus acutangulus TaxID=402998 RepID=A0A9Q1M0T0_9SOLA|nr:hypothetical protein K7X08_030777 [Anisodus acutangulus]